MYLGFSYLYSFAHRSVFLDNLIVFFASYFPYIVIFLAGIFLLFHHEIFGSREPLKQFMEKWKEFFVSFFAGMAAWIAAQALKFFIHTSRPAGDLLLQTKALFLADGYAFPSGHAAFFFGLAQSIFFFHKKAGYIFFLFALLISIARVMAGVHSPLDILGGAVLGIALAYLCRKI
jgi:membrane-associated phospholipid phosphatase